MTRFSIQNFWYINKETYIFSEVYSTILFMTSILSIFDLISKNGVVWGILFSTVIYAIFLYVRIFLYKKYGISQTDFKIFFIGSIAIVIYTFIANAIKMNIIVWIIPLLFNLVTANIDKLSSDKWGNYYLKLNKQLEKIFVKINLWLCLTLFVNYVFTDIRKNVISFSWFKKFSVWLLNEQNSEKIAYQISIPLVSMLVGLVLMHSILFFLVNPIIKNSELVSKYAKRRSYPTHKKMSRRFHR